MVMPKDRKGAAHGSLSCCEPHPESYEKNLSVASVDKIIYMAAPHEAAGLARRRMKIMLSISQFYRRGLIYQARPGRFIHVSTGFDESNRCNLQLGLYLFFLRVSSCNFVANFLVIFMVGCQLIIH
ncbi:MAG: hypothetical protein JSV88_09895 [Candidatus Aminicenantes bacterium]|nr:MAG: hypothetical protein JSV88_09895 [Candidatus Aminicenantes bacterium]